MPNYVQADFRIPITDAKVTVQPHQKNDRTGNPLNLSGPVAAYQQPGQANPPAVTRAQLAGGPMGVSQNGPFEGT